ncbi:hypothetical protein ABZZ79_03175 [Streptomyces sp. NPDC006458]|uniref:hypothetical protein n=1 Tax=Streptomyces sp. NPDC006458 TaxID=3154302 RepID=UPI0033A3ED0B
MPRIQLAHWHGQHQPGDEIDVTAEELVALRRDGRVAQVVTDPPQAAAAADPVPDTTPAEAVEEPAPEPPARSSRKRP